MKKENNMKNISKKRFKGLSALLLSVTVANGEIIVHQEFRGMMNSVGLMGQSDGNSSNPGGNPFAASYSKAFEYFDSVGNKTFRASGSAQFQGERSGGEFSGSGSVAGEVFYVLAGGNETGWNEQEVNHWIDFELTTPYAFTYTGDRDAGGDGVSRMTLGTSFSDTIASEGVVSGVLDPGHYLLYAYSSIDTGSRIPSRYDIGAGTASYSFSLSLREVPDTGASASLLVAGLSGLALIGRRHVVTKVNPQAE